MSKENQLRKRIIACLKARKQPEERILDTHGSNEFGLDLVILKLDAFRKLRAYGVQIKTGNIKCSGKATQKIKEIIGQLSIAFGKPINVDEREYRIDGLYLVTDGEFQGNTIDYIKSACVCIRNLHFIDGQSLNEFFASCEPEKDQFKET